ncbi:MAG: shikimate kinase, partial [Desulfosarcina sp.]
KTTVGETLADRLGWAFTDTDRLIVDAAGIGIKRMVAEHGWPYFRMQERRIMQTVCARNRQVVATGGGIILDARNVLAMRMSGKIVWLTASRRTIAKRILDDDATAGNRPPLTDCGVWDEIASVLSEREPLYRKAADRVVDTDRETISAIVDRIVRVLDLSPEP